MGIMTQKELEKNLKDWRWRLNHLYQITDEQGKQITFQENMAQHHVIDNLHWLNVILKSRQLGVTTLFCLMMLDYALFNKNVQCGFVAHGLDEAKKIFRTKIKFPFENLPPTLRKAIGKPVKDDAGTLELANGSSITVATSLRSGSFQWVHISEYGKICAKYPERAREVRAGTMETVHQGCYLTIESTAEGPEGDFYERCMQAQALKRQGKKLGPMDYKFFFLPWFWKESNATDPQFVEITPDDEKYFAKIEAENDVTLTPEQKAWYVAKSESAKTEMMQEHPSTPDEAFSTSVEGAYWATEIQSLYRRKPPQITRLIHDPSLPVHTVHDPGYHWAIWFVQDPDGVYPKFLRYIEDIGHGVEYYAELLDKLADDYGWRYGKHIAPVDVDSNGHRQVGGDTIFERAQQNGLYFEQMEVVEDSQDLIEETRVALNTYYFDEEGCKDGIKAASSFKRKIIRGLSTEKKPVFLEKYEHNWASHGATALYHFVKARRDGYFYGASYEVAERNHIVRSPGMF